MRLRVLTTLRDWRGLRVACGIWLSLFMAAGPTSVYAATYYVNAATGDDSRTAVQAQSSATPWQTLTRAIKGTTFDPNAPAPNPELASGDTILVAPGTYDQSLGEQYPLFLVDGVQIIGAGPGQTILHSPANELVFDNAYFSGTPTSLGPGTLLMNTTISSDPPTSTYTMAISAIRLIVPNAPVVGFAPGTDTMSPRIENNEFLGGDAPGIAIEIYTTGYGGTFDGLIQNNSFSGFGSDPNQPPITDPNDPNSVDVYAGWGVQAVVGVDPNSPGTTDTVSPTIRNNTFSDNFGGAGGLFIYYPYVSFTPTVEYNQFTDEFYDFNSTDLIGGGQATNSPIVRNNTFHDTGGAMMLQFPTIFPQISRVLAPQFLGNSMTNTVGMITWATFAGPSAFPKAGTSQPRALPEGAEATPTFQGNQIHASVLGVSAGFVGAMQNLNVTMSNNTVAGTAVGGGILVYPISSAGIGTPLLSSPTITVDGNTFGGGTENYIGLLLYLGGDPNDPNIPAADTQVTNNLFQGNIGGALIGSYFYSTKSPLFSCNSFTANEGGVYQMSQPDPPVDMGGGNASSPGNNVFSGNNTWDIYFETYDPNDPNAPDPNDPNNPKLFAQSNYFAASPLVTLGVDTSSPLGSPPVGCSVGSTIAVADLALTKTATPAVVGPGNRVTFMLTVHNNGPDTATNANVVDILPPDVTFVSASPECVDSSGTVTCTVASLASGASQTFQIIVDAPDYEVPTIVNGATVSSDQIDPDPSNDSTNTGFAASASAATGIPTASEWGLILMAMLLGAAGLWLMRKRRHAGAAMMILLVAGVFAPRARAADQPPRQPGQRERVKISADHVPLHRVAKIDQNGGEVIFTWADGKTLVVPADRLTIHEIKWSSKVDARQRKAAKQSARSTGRPGGVMTPRPMNVKLLREKLKAQPADGLWVLVSQPSGSLGKTDVVAFESKQIAILFGVDEAQTLMLKKKSTSSGRAW